MRDNLKVALILGAALILAAILNGGIYQIVIAGAGSGGSGGSHDVSGETGTTEIVAYRMNRFTGEVALIRNYTLVNVREYHINWPKSSVLPTPSPARELPELP